MKAHTISFVIVALMSSAACSRPRSPEAALRASAGPTAATPAVRGDGAQEDLDKLQGAWRIESSWWNGVPDPVAAQSVTILFQGNKFIVVDRDGNRQEETIRLMPGQDPKAIDCWSKGGGQPSPGIYCLEGDRFQWCSAGAGNRVRPTSFESKPGSRQSLLVLRREKR